MGARGKETKRRKQQLRLQYPVLLGELHRPQRAEEEQARSRQEPDPQRRQLPPPPVLQQAGRGAEGEGEEEGGQHEVAVDFYSFTALDFCRMNR